MNSTKVVLLSLFAAMGLGLGLWLMDEPQPVAPESAASVPLEPEMRIEGASPGLVSGGKATVDAEQAPVRRESIAREQSAPRATAKQQQKEVPGLRGVVVDAAGHPIPDAEVQVSGINAMLRSGAIGIQTSSGYREGNPGTWARTDSDGRFEVSRGKRGKGELELEVWARGFQPFTTHGATRSESGTEDLGVFTLEAGVVLRGIVTTSEGTPLGGARVRPEREGMALDAVAEFTASQSGQGSGETTDAEGRFELAHFAPGRYSLEVAHDLHASTTFDGDAGPMGTERSGLVLAMQPSAELAGRILGFPAGRTGVLVAARELEDESAVDVQAMDILLGELFGSGPSGEVDESGHFTIHGLLPGRRYQVEAQIPATFLERTTCSDRVICSAPNQSVELEWDGGGAVEFSVVDADSGELLGPITVLTRWNHSEFLALPHPGQESEFQSGEVLLNELRAPDPQATLEIRVSAEGYLDLDLDPFALGDERLADLGVVRLSSAPLIRVHVLDATTGEPVQRASVRLTRGPEQQGDSAAAVMFRSGSGTIRGKTDAEGICEIRPAVLGLAQLTVQRSGFADWSNSEVHVSGGGEQDITANLVEGGRVEVTVLDAFGEPASGLVVEHSDPYGSIRTRKTKNRPLTFKDLATGVHGFRLVEPSSTSGTNIRVSVMAATGAPVAEEQDWNRIQVNSGSSSRLTLEAPRSASVAGVVRIGQSTLADARITFQPGRAERALEEFVALVQAQSMGNLQAPGSRRTDRNGRYELEDVAAGEHRLEVVHKRLALPQSIPVFLQAGRNTVNIDLAERSIEGIVVGSDGVAIAGASMRLMPPSTGSNASEAEDFMQAKELLGIQEHSVKTDENGRFLLEGLPADGPYVIRAKAPGWGSGFSEPIQVAEGETRDGVEIQLTRGGSLRVQILGEATGIVVVTARIQGEQPEGVQTTRVALAQQGQARILDLAAGTWEVSIDPGDVPVESVAVLPGAESVVTFSP